jgi:Glycosyltransferase Family 4
MKIAQIAPLMESVPPRLYGGTERVVSYLTDELVRLGHEVTLFASADSITAAELVGCASMALRLDRNVRDPCRPASSRHPLPTRLATRSSCGVVDENEGRRRI